MFNKVKEFFSKKNKQKTNVVELPSFLKNSANFTDKEEYWQKRNHLNLRSLKKQEIRNSEPVKNRTWRMFDILINNKEDIVIKNKKGEFKPVIISKEVKNG